MASLKLAYCYPRYAMIQTSFQKEKKIKKENRQDILRQENNKILHALASIPRLLTRTHSYTILRPKLVLVRFSCPFNANVIFMFQAILSE